MSHLRGREAMQKREKGLFSVYRRVGPGLSREQRLRTPFKTLVLGSGLIHEKGCPLLFYPNRFG
jgi:hypothetical protein